MKFLKINYTILDQNPGWDGINHLVEWVGRVCYHSHHLIKEGSAENMVNALMRLNHGSPLEHGTVYLHLNISRDIEKKWDNNDLYKIFLKSFFNDNPYSKVIAHENGEDFYVTTNLRVIFENKINDKKILDIVKEHPEMFCETPTEYHEKRISVYFECDRPTGESFLRHRKGSFARESTRYCNYSNEQKFGGELKIAVPSFVNGELLEEIEGENTISSLFDKAYTYGSDNPLEVWLLAVKVAEWSYMRLTELGWKAEEARSVLPFTVYSPLCMTMFESDWAHFFGLRALNKTGQAHPDAQALAKPLMDKFIELGYYGMGNESV